MAGWRHGTVRPRAEEIRRTESTRPHIRNRTPAMLLVRYQPASALPPRLPAAQCTCEGRWPSTSSSGCSIAGELPVPVELRPVRLPNLMSAGEDQRGNGLDRVPSGLGLEALDERCGRDVESGMAAPSQGRMRPAWPHHPRYRKDSPPWPSPRTSTAPSTRSGTGSPALPHASRLGRHRRHESNGVRALVLATTVRRTGSPRRTCLIYGTSGNEYVVVASEGDAEQDPGIVHETRGGPQHRGAGRQSPVHRTRPRRVRGRARAPLGQMVTSPRSITTTRRRPTARSRSSRSPRPG
jgi:hypothetical protein